MIEKMKERRTIRKYRQEDVPESLVEELLEVASRASNTGNMQLYSVVVTRDAGMKKQLDEAHFHQPMVTEAPVVLTFCADANRFTKWAEAGKAEAGFDNLQMFIAATIDAMLFAEAFAEAAEERGLGLCFLGTTAYNAGEIVRVLRLPRWSCPSSPRQWDIRQNRCPSYPTACRLPPSYTRSIIRITAPLTSGNITRRKRIWR